MRSPGDPVGCRALGIIRLGSRNVGEAAAKNGKLPKIKSNKLDLFS